MWVLALLTTAIASIVDWLVFQPPPQKHFPARNKHMSLSKIRDMTKVYQDFLGADYCLARGIVEDFFDGTEVSEASLRAAFVYFKRNTHYVSGSFLNDKQWKLVEGIYESNYAGETVCLDEEK